MRSQTLPAVVTIRICVVALLVGLGGCARADSPNENEAFNYCWSDTLGGYTASERGQCKPGYGNVSQAEFRKRREAAAYAAFASAYPDVASVRSETILTDQFDVAGSGTAFFVTPDGYLITNKHVVEGCDVMTLVASSGLHLLLVIDTSKIDLALLKSSESVDRFALFTIRPLRVGENIYAIGYPLLGELGGIIVTDGIISSLVGPPDSPQYLQISAAIQPGNSGGPLVDQHGTIAGVVTAKNSGPVGDAFLEGVGFAVRPSLIMGFMLNNGVEPLLWNGGPTPTPNVAEFVSTFTYPVLCWVRKEPAP